MYELEYSAFEEIPDEVSHLYKEGDGKWYLLSPGNLRTIDDVSRVQEGARKEREAHKVTKQKLAAFDGIDCDDMYKKLDRLKELELSSTPINEEQIEKIVEGRILSKTAPLERKISTLTEERNKAFAETEEFKLKDVSRAIHDKIRKAAVDAKIRNSALEDAMLIGENLFCIDESNRVVTKDNVGVTPGVEPAVWLSEIKSTRPHWWPESQGVGAIGGNGQSGGENPFSANGWNMTQQGKLVRANRSAAEQMAKVAGTSIGGPKPNAKSS